MNLAGSPPPIGRLRLGGGQCLGHVPCLLQRVGVGQHAVVDGHHDKALGHPAVDLVVHHLAGVLAAHAPGAAMDHEDHRGILGILWMIDIEALRLVRAIGQVLDRFDRRSCRGQPILDSVQQGGSLRGADAQQAREAKGSTEKPGAKVGGKKQGHQDGLHRQPGFEHATVTVRPGE